MFREKLFIYLLCVALEMFDNQVWVDVAHGLTRRSRQRHRIRTGPQQKDPAACRWSVDARMDRAAQRLIFRITDDSGDLVSRRWFALHDDVPQKIHVRSVLRRQAPIDPDYCIGIGPAILDSNTASGHYGDPHGFEESRAHPQGVDLDIAQIIPFGESN